MAVNLMPDVSIYKDQQPSLMDLLKSISAIKDFQTLAQKNAGVQAGAGPVPSLGVASSGGPPPGTSSAERGGPPSASAMAASQFDPMYTAADQKFGLPAGTMKGMGWIESRNDPRAWTRGSSYKGLMQLGPDEARTHGTNVWDPASSIEGAGQIAAGNQYAFRQVMGRDPTAHEIYVMHQQGRAGGIALMGNPDMPAYKALQQGTRLSAAEATRHITANGGDPYAPASQFVSKWARFYGPNTASKGGTAMPATMADAVKGAGVPDIDANTGGAPGASKLDAQGNEIVVRSGGVPQ